MKPLPRHFCALFLTAACIASIITIRNKNAPFPHLDELMNTSSTQVQDLLSEDYSNVSLDKFWLKKNDAFLTLARMSGSVNVQNTNLVVQTQDLYFLGLFDLSTKFGKRPESDSEVLSAKLAVEHINQIGLLPGFNLKFIINDTMCDPGVAIDRFFHSIYSNKTITMLLGSWCSNVTESLANVVPYWNILQVSFGSKSPALSDRAKFPLFFRTIAPDSSLNPAKVSFIKHFKWGTFATLSQTENEFLLPMNKLVKQLEEANVTCSGTITFSTENYKEQMQVLKDLDTRIIIASFSSTISSKIFCEAYALKMYGADYVWILQEHQLSTWSRGSGCKETEFKQAIDGAILISNYNVIVDNITSISGLTNEKFEAQLLSNCSEITISKYTRQIYDAIWAMALTIRRVQDLHCSVILGDFDYTRQDMVKKFISQMSKLKFMGVSGPVMFNGPDRIGNSVFKQIQGRKMQPVGIYYSNNNFLDFKCKKCKRIQWKNNRVPIAQRVLKLRLIKIPKYAFGTVVITSGIGIIICFLFLYFNLHFRQVKAVKLSSPRLNNTTAIGCIIVYAGVILLGFDQSYVNTKQQFSWLCMGRVYLLCAGFSLAFGSMFARTYRVHRIFIYSGTSLLKDKLLKDQQLIASIFGLLLIDGVIIVFWTALDPMEFHLHNLTIELNTENRGIVYQPQVGVCRSGNTTGWFIAIYGYKAILLIMSVYLAWETRHIKVQVLNDSQYIGICVYSAVASALFFLLSTLLSDYTTLSYLVASASILTSTSITLLLLFIPKVKAVLGKIQTDDPITQSMGLKVECNTRRLMVDDPKELIYRVEIQNRVYRNEIVRLDLEIAKLEKILQKLDQQENKKMKNKSPIISFSQRQSRASWPSSSKSSLLHVKGLMMHDSILERHSSEHYFEKLRIFDKLKQFFGSIPTVWLRIPSENSLKNEAIFESPFKEKHCSNPEMQHETLSVIPDTQRSNSAHNMHTPSQNLEGSFKNNPYVLSFQTLQ